MDIKPKIVDQADAKHLDSIEGNIIFDHVSFSYDNANIALKDLSISISAGQTVALVGTSGGGKSTTLNLIPRFYDADRGKITVDGVNVRDVTLASLRNSIALVSQEIMLFDDTVRANIAYGRPGASDEDIVEAAKNADAHDFIVGLKDGYDTHVGGRGVKLSGGQRQRVAIARAMLKNAPILLLDEATSALDSETERQIQLALDRLTKGRTTVVIAHRLSTVMRADKIYVMEAGKVLESGTHLELLAKEGAYARLHAVQFADQEQAQEVSAAAITG